MSMGPLRQLGFALIWAALAGAQTGTLAGDVKDQSGVPVPRARVTLTGAGRTSARAVQANSAGAYVFTGLPPGEYAVEASAPKLVQHEPPRVQVHAGEQRLDLVLSIPDVVENVTVQDQEGGAVTTAASDNASALVIRGADLDALSDNPDDLEADLQALAGPSAGPNGGSTYIDGFSGGELPPKSSIREVRINQNPFSPEYDKLGYGRIDILTKPGSDRYRGTMNYNVGSDLFNSRNPYSSAKAPFLLNEFEGDAGGPLGQRASFIVDAQRNMVNNGSVTNAIVVDPATLAVTPFSSTVVSPQVLSRVNPRVDYQLSENNTLTMRYDITHATIGNTGVGAFDLASRGYETAYTNQTVQLGETAVRGTVVNETRFQFYRTAIQMLADSTAPQLRVLGAFNGGGSQYGRSYDTQNSYEFQNNTSVLKGAHSFRAGVRLRAAVDDNTSPLNFNGTFTFSSADRYRRTLLYAQLGYSPAAIRALGGGASEFTLTAGQPQLTVSQGDVAVYAGDEWRARPNLTLNLGLRYEAQTNLHDWSDFAPRLALAWAPGSGHNGARAKTVLRAGFGMFYDRFALLNVLNAKRDNGVIEQQYVIANPDFYPALPPPSVLAADAVPQSIDQISRTLRAPYILQTAVTVERQISAGTKASLTYSNSHGVHEYRSNDINAPFEGTYPAGHPGPVMLMESSGLYNQNQLIANVSARARDSVSLFGFYVLNRALSNTDGFSTSPANPYNFSGEYGPALTDVRHRLALGGSLTMRWNIRLSPFIVLQSGMPFDITSGNDFYGTTLFNARPSIAGSALEPDLVATPYGLLNPNPLPGERILGRNAGRGPGQFTLNLRVAKTVGFGGERGGAAAKKTDAGSSSASGPINPTTAVTGRGLGALMRPAVTSRRYNLSIGLSARNILNHLNPGPIVGDITSPLFGHANQIAATPNGEGFYETASNRRLEWQLRFTF